MEYPEQEGIHKDPQTLTPKIIILMGGQAPARLKHIKLMQLKEATKAPNTPNIFSIFASSWHFPKFLPPKFPALSAPGAQVFVLHFLSCFSQS